MNLGYEIDRNMRHLLNHNSKISPVKGRVQNRVATNSENGPNTEYIRFWKFNEYRIPNNSFFENKPNTEYE